MTIAITKATARSSRPHPLRCRPPESPARGPARRLAIGHMRELGGAGARHQLDRGRSCLRSQHAVEDVAGVSAVFGPVGSIDFAGYVVLDVDERDVLLYTAGPNPT